MYTGCSSSNLKGSQESSLRSDTGWSPLRFSCIPCEKYISRSHERAAGYSANSTVTVLRCGTIKSDCWYSKLSDLKVFQLTPQITSLSSSLRWIHRVATDCAERTREVGKPGFNCTRIGNVTKSIHLSIYDYWMDPPEMENPFEIVITCNFLTHNFGWILTFL